MRARLSLLALMALPWAGCGLDSLTDGSDGVLLLVPADADETTERMVAQTETYLREITGGDPIVARVGSGRFEDIVRRSSDRGSGLVLVFDADRLASDEITTDRVDALPEGSFVLHTQDVGAWPNRLGTSGATFVLMAGASTLSRQYATYEVMRRLGVRFFHPEHEYVPEHALADLRELSQRPTAIHRGSDEHTPDFHWRSWNFHSTHPLEHLEAFSDAAHPIDEARHVNEWQVKNFGNRFRGAGRSVASEASTAQRTAELEAMRAQLGFPTGTGITLHNEQQGSSAEVDRDSPVPVRDQIEQLVTQRLTDTPDADWFGIHFGTTEFGTTPDEETVQWINWAGQRALALSPGIHVEINDHITGTQPTLHYDDQGCAPGTNPDGRADYYDLAFHTDPRLGVRVHTVMFYPLEGPARVYNQKTFAHKRCLMEKASAEGRPLGWFPEGSWWLSFDNSIPVYLPLHVWTRWRDVDLLRPLLASRGGGTLLEHRMFNSGQEWGYWQQDYAVGLLGWNADVTPAQIWDEILDPLCDASQWREGCPAKREVLAILNELVDHQREFFLEREDFRGRPGGLFTYFAGEDQADVIAASTGFEFRPVRVGFDEVMTWDRAQIEHFVATDLAAINDSAVVHATFRDRLRKVTEFVPEPGRPWFDEIADGIEINEMRARQIAGLYTAVLAVRDAQIGSEPEPLAFGEAQYSAAQMALRQAETVIRRREAAYRYPPAQMYGGGLTADTAVPNGTTYPWRVHTKTHLLTYWRNRDAQVRAILDGNAPQDARVQMIEAIDEVGAQLQIGWPDEGPIEGSVVIGDSMVVDPSITTLDLGPAAGYWTVVGAVNADNPYIDARGAVVRTNVRASTPKSGLTLSVPADPTAQEVLKSVFPSLQWAWLADPNTLVFATDENADGSVDFRRVVKAPVAKSQGDAFQTEPVVFTLPVSTSGGGTVEVHLSDVVLDGQLVAGSLAHPIRLRGQISVPDLVTTLVELAGFDEAGSLSLLAGYLGFDADAPPATVPVDAELTVEPRID